MSSAGRFAFISPASRYTTWETRQYYYVRQSCWESGRCLIWQAIRVNIERETAFPPQKSPCNWHKAMLNGRFYGWQPAADSSDPMSIVVAEPGPLIHHGYTTHDCVQYNYAARLRIKNLKLTGWRQRCAVCRCIPRSISLRPVCFLSSAIPFNHSISPLDKYSWPHVNSLKSCVPIDTIILTT